MLQSFKKIFASASILLMIFGANAAFALELGQTGLETAAGKAGYQTGTSGGGDLPAIVGGIIKTLLGILGVVFLVLMVYAGFLWMTARGEKDQVTKAKDIIRNSIIGLIIITAAYAITGFVVSRLASAGEGGGGGGAPVSSGLPSGSTCTSDSQCQSGACVDIGLADKECQ